MDSARIPRIAVDANGNATTVWFETNGLNVWSNRYNVGMGWGTATIIGSSAAGAKFPIIAMDANGNALAVWEETDSSSIVNAVSSRYTIAGGWTSAALIEASAGNVMRPQIAIDASGSGLAAWGRSDGVTQSVMFNRFE